MAESSSNPTDSSAPDNAEGKGFRMFWRKSRSSGGSSSLQFVPQDPSSGGGAAFPPMGKDPILTCLKAESVYRDMAETKALL